MQLMNGRILKFEPGVPGYGNFDIRETTRALNQWLKSRGLDNRGGMRGLNEKLFKKKKGGQNHGR